ncbi:hypothetical protein SNE40_000840 [Patella caerulea]|uniref:Uncharacterized protein n=1 Tax=Patella caerulea TaxID=87958 RepID=A0AAN8Q267_PATCE
MCLLFLLVNNNAKADEYKLVLVNNRDEYWNRPTKLADFWGKDLNCISGLDDEPGREGGTWLGMNKNGRIGILLNIFGEMDPNKKGRGFFVSDFLSSTEDPTDYISKFSSDKSSYNGFHLILLDHSKSGYNVNYFTNFDEDNLSKRLNREESIGISNSPYHKPWQKVLNGQPRFQSVINQYPRTRDKDQLIDGLFNLMLDKTQLYPDPVLIKMSGQKSDKLCDESVLKQRSALCVCCPTIEYGTRTTTIILVSGSGECNYIEKTLVLPFNPDDPQYITKSHQFNLTPE